MTMTQHAPPGTLHTPNVLRDLLHALCQPMTALRCSLELSRDRDTLDNGRPNDDTTFPTGLTTNAFLMRQQESITIALQKTDEAIDLIRLIQEHLDADQPTSGLTT